ncbi:MAG: ABC transporter permease [Deinococcota bacterium]
MTTSSPNQTRSRLRRIAPSPPLIALLLAIGLFFLGGVIRPGFVNVNQAVNILRLASLLGIVAAGQTLVIISGGEGIDLSVGSVVTLGAILTFRFSNGSNWLLIVGLVVALLAGALVGLVNGVGIVGLRIPPLVMTLGMAGVVEGIVLVVTQGAVQGGTPPLLAGLISSNVLGIPGSAYLWAGVAVGMWLLLERSTYGKHLFAIGVNRQTARLSGVRVPRVVLITYTLSGMLAALGGFCLLGFTQRVFLSLGVPYLFPSIAAVVVGGTVLAGGKGSYWGTMAGALVLTLINSLLTAMQLSEAYQLMVLGTTLVVLISIYGRQRGVRQ